MSYVAYHTLFNQILVYCILSWTCLKSYDKGCFGLLDVKGINHRKFTLQTAQLGSTQQANPLTTQAVLILFYDASQTKAYTFRAFWDTLVSAPTGM